MDLQSYPYQIEIDANRANEGQYYRIERIHRILGYAQALADADNNQAFCKKVKSIYEFKGHLTVSWDIEPSELEKEYFQIAWGSIVTDYESNEVEHEI